MLVALTLAVLATAPSTPSAGSADVRVPLIEMQLAGDTEAALAATRRLLAEEPEAADTLGLDYLEGHLLDQIGRWSEAHRAFARSMSSSAGLDDYSLYRLALSNQRLGHPEVAAGLLARLLSGRAPQPLIEPATELLVRFVGEGGDCDLLRDVTRWPLRGPAHRELELAAAECDLRRGRIELAGQRLLGLLRGEPSDETARLAATRVEQSFGQLLEQPKVARLVGEALHHNREFDRSTRYLLDAIVADLASGRLDRDQQEALYQLARGHFWRGEYLVAASRFGQLAAALAEPRDRARPLYQQARCYELDGSWELAARSYRLAYLADPSGRWSDPALLSALRIEWRMGDEAPALELYELLGSRREWRDTFGRAALFLAASDLPRGRTERAGGWLDDADRVRGGTPQELAYWRGRLAEAEDRAEAAVERYLDAVAAEPFHPFGDAARQRLTRPNLEAAAASATRRRAGSRQVSDLYAASLTLDAGVAEAAGAREALRRRLAADPRARAYLEVSTAPPAAWPLWRARLGQPEEVLLALGIWDQAGAVMLRHFPVTDVRLGYTGSWLLARGRQHRASLRIAEILADRMPEGLPEGLAAGELRRLVFPYPYRELIEAESARRGVEPELLAALIREESRFDATAQSAASARGLTQFVLPTARDLAGRIGLERLEAADLHRPEVSIALGAAYLEELGSRFRGSTPAMLAAYNAGENQAELWRSYCYSREPEEYLTKVGFRETREYLGRVLTSRAHYRDLYRAGGAAP